MHYTYIKFKHNKHPERITERDGNMADEQSLFQKWAMGYGAISHQKATQIKVQYVISELAQKGQSEASTLALFTAADRIANAAMWLVVHQTYASCVDLEGQPLDPNAFKTNPQGHTGGSLNMVPAYVGFMLANALSERTRGWVMEQGHCVAAIDSVNLLLDNMCPEHEKRYELTNEGLTRYVTDFYSYRLNKKGQQDSPLGSHVNIHTAGGILEGGYLGFAGLQYSHMPLPNESLVAFLSDGAFEEQRGSDWAPHWWRATDCGFVIPMMIFNGRRIDQRSLEAQGEGLSSFLQHLKTYHFDPMVFDGTDPAAFACLILEGERLLQARGQSVLVKEESYPVLLPYGVAVAPKGAGFYGAGTNAAHSLPLSANPKTDAVARRRFNEGVQRLFVPFAELIHARDTLKNHAQTKRPSERDYPIANRHVRIKSHPQLLFYTTNGNEQLVGCPMSAIDNTFLAYVQANPELRPRVGNPDEMLSNHMLKTLHHLKHRVTEVESQELEAIDGQVITVLNEEAVVCACLGNKAGINLVVTYEAFALKMLGAIRQELNWSDELHACGKKPGWLSVPLVLTSHTYENGKNERSHQDTTLCEALLSEYSDVSRVLFPADYNSTVTALDGCYRMHGAIVTLVVSKEKVPLQWSEQQAKQLLEDGIIRMRPLKNPDKADIILTAIGSYQLQHALIAEKRLAERGIVAVVNYMMEPGRFRNPRTPREALFQTSYSLRQAYYPAHIASRIFISHTRPEVMAGVLRPLDTGKQTIFLGFINQGGTLDTAGMLFVNRQTWAHILSASANCLGFKQESLLKPQEIEALSGLRNPHGVII